MDLLPALEILKSNKTVGGEVPQTQRAIEAKTTGLQCFIRSELKDVAFYAFDRGQGFVLLLAQIW